MGKLEITKNDLKKRFAEYNDLYFQNKLAAFYNEITDYRTAEDVGVDRPKKNEILHHIPPTTAHARPGGVYRKADAVRQVGRRDHSGQTTTV